MRQLILICLLTLLAFSSASAAEALYGTITGWGQMIDPDGNSRFEVGRNRVTILFGTGRKGLDAEGGPTQMNAPRVLASVDGDFSVSTIVKGNLPLPEMPFAYISGGLVLMQDGQNYIRLERANFIRRGSKSFYTNFEQRIDAKRTRMGRFADFSLERDRDVELRLEVQGDTVRGLVRHTGEDWHEMGTAKIDSSQLFHVGVSGVKTIEDEVAVTFTNFCIDRDSSVEPTDSSEIDLSPPAGKITLPMVANSALVKLIPKINELQAKSTRIAEVSDAEMDELLEDAKALASEEIEGLPEPVGVGIAQALAERFRKAGEPERAVRVYREIAEVIAKMDDETVGAKKGIERLHKLSKQLETKLQMIGQPIEVTGKLLSGQTIQWSDYQGKVVLVDFWASWCGPCRREIPNIKKQYDAYHGKGFEVVGVCLDRGREKAEEYIESAEIPWQSIFDQDAEDKSMAERYGIMSIPTAILVDREGKVVSLEAPGETLPQLLAKMFDSPDDPQAEGDDAETTESETNPGHTESSCE